VRKRQADGRKTSRRACSGTRAIMDDLVRDAIFKILKPLKDRDNISRKEAERIEDDVAESVSFAF
jgi:hypothetical protein